MEQIRLVVTPEHPATEVGARSKPSAACSLQVLGNRTYIASNTNFEYGDEVVNLLMLKVYDNDTDTCLSTERYSIGPYEDRPVNAVSMAGYIGDDGKPVLAVLIGVLGKSSYNNNGESLEELTAELYFAKWLPEDNVFSANRVYKVPLRPGEDFWDQSVICDVHIACVDKQFKAFFWGGNLRIR